MASFTWTAGTSADWNTSNWTPTTGAPPGATTTNTDAASILGTNLAYSVTIGASDPTFDVASLTIAGGSTSHTTGLDIQGTLKTTTLTYSNTNSSTDALITVDNGGLLDVRTSLSASKAETLTVAGTTTGGHLELGSTSVNSTNVTFGFSDNTSAKSAGVIEFLSGYSAGITTTQKISGLGWGNGIVFDGANFTGDTFAYSSGVLTVKSGTTTVLTMDNLSGTNLSPTSFVGNGSEILVVCFAAGTRILTATGERVIDSLLQGDIVLTLADGELQARPVKWVGRRRIDIAAHPHPETVAPIRIRRGAFAETMPHTDLLVSPDHAIFVDHKLICARQLANGTTIRQETDCTFVDYFHVELDAHAILLAEGLPAESYLDTGNRNFFANSGEPVLLHPDLTDEADYPTRHAGSCAPFVWDEASVEPVWRKLAQRATTLGQPVPELEATADPAPHIAAKGRMVKPLYAEDGLFIFALPKGAAEVRLVSRAAAPTDARPWLEDRRRLGLYVERIVLRGVDDLREVPLDHPDLVRGWWAVERSGVTLRRWTDGDAILPLPVMDGPAMLEIRAGSSGLLYPVARDQEARAA